MPPGLPVPDNFESNDRSAFREPEYHGAIAAAPRVMHMADQLLDKLQDFQDKTDLLVNNIQILSGQVDRLSLLGTAGEESNRRVLVIADIHNNPVGLDFAQALVHHFQVDTVLDAGDLTDFGKRVTLGELDRVVSGRLKAH